MKKTALIVGSAFILVFMMGIVSGMNPLDNEDRNFDNDGDGLLNHEEFAAGSDPNNWDTDGDGLPDGWECEAGMNPVDPSDAKEDFDYFGGEEHANYNLVDHPYDNYAEYYRLAYIDTETGEEVYGPTDPTNPDSDGDGILDPDDYLPLYYDSENPSTPPDGEPGPGGDGDGPAVDGDGDGDGNADDDGDGLTDTEEMRQGTDPNNPDTDGDGLNDAGEISRGLDPNDWDTDNDMLIDGVEGGSGDSTDGHVVDTDNDGTGTPPNKPDRPNPDPTPIPPNDDPDNDGVITDREYEIGTDPYNPDTDGDGLMDGEELTHGYDPNDWDTDNDMLIDGVEMAGGDSTDGHINDTDDDGIPT
ncbi:MAG: hypothetical protein KAH57_05260 [Thermoplasmata archaeon]|nr:hypothetical protein [Thermoplasmata archaeon]